MHAVEHCLSRGNILFRNNLGLLHAWDPYVDNASVGKVRHLSDQGSRNCLASASRARSGHFVQWSQRWFWHNSPELGARGSHCVCVVTLTEKAFVMAAQWYRLIIVQQLVTQNHCIARGSESVYETDGTNSLTVARVCWRVFAKAHQPSIFPRLCIFQSEGKPLVEYRQWIPSLKLFNHTVPLMSVWTSPATRACFVQT